jgi:hypothetical protein
MLRRGQAGPADGGRGGADDDGCGAAEQGEEPAAGQHGVHVASPCETHGMAWVDYGTAGQWRRRQKGPWRSLAERHPALLRLAMALAVIKGQPVMYRMRVEDGMVIGKPGSWIVENEFIRSPAAQSSTQTR